MPNSMPYSLLINGTLRGASKGPLYFLQRGRGRRRDEIEADVNVVTFAGSQNYGARILMGRFILGQDVFSESGCSGIGVTPYRPFDVFPL